MVCSISLPSPHKSTRDTPSCSPIQTHSKRVPNVQLPYSPSHSPVSSCSGDTYENPRPVALTQASCRLDSERMLQDAASALASLKHGNQVCITPPTPSPSPPLMLSNVTILPDALSASYELMDDLGSGAYGRIISAIHLPSRTPVAIKVVKRDAIPKNRWILDNELGWVPMEVYVMKNVRHHNMIELYDVFETDAYLFIVMQLFGTAWKDDIVTSPVLDERLDKQLQQDLLTCHVPRRTRSMDLFELLNQRFFNEHAAHVVFFQLVQVLYHLSQYGILHGDVKDENILIDEKGNIKLIDFGGAVFMKKTVRNDKVERDTLLKPSQFFGTPEFSPPEIVAYSEYKTMCLEHKKLKKPFVQEDRFVNFMFDGDKAQVWSCGLVLYYMIYGCMPHESHQYCRQNVSVSFHCLDLLRGMLEKDPSRRLRMADVVQHPWFQEQPNASFDI